MKRIFLLLSLISAITMNYSCKSEANVESGNPLLEEWSSDKHIPPFDKIRTIMYYPLALGRNFDEIMRVLVALQTADNFGVAMPADWRPGDEVIVPTAGSCGVAKERMQSSEDEMHCYDWFFCTKKLSKEEVEKKLGK